MIFSEVSKERDLWLLGSRLHRAGAVLIGLFLIMHLGNHLAAIGGVKLHIDIMAQLRPIYRNAVIEPLLVLAVATQLSTGIYRVLTTWRVRHGIVDRLQAASGLYIATFLLIHLGAIFAARMDGVETNFYFAAAGMHVPNWPWFFVPYYGLAVFAVFAHPACALHWHLISRGRKTAANCVLTTMLVVGAAIAVTIISTLAGLTVPVEIPQAYLASFSN